MHEHFLTRQQAVNIKRYMVIHVIFCMLFCNNITNFCFTKLYLVILLTLGGYLIIYVKYILTAVEIYDKTPIKTVYVFKNIIFRFPIKTREGFFFRFLALCLLFIFKTLDFFSCKNIQTHLQKNLMSSTIFNDMICFHFIRCHITYPKTKKKTQKTR